MRGCGSPRGKARPSLQEIVMTGCKFPGSRERQGPPNRFVVTDKLHDMISETRSRSCLRCWVDKDVLALQYVVQCFNSAEMQYCSQADIVNDQVAMSIDPGSTWVCILIFRRASPQRRAYSGASSRRYGSPTVITAHSMAVPTFTAT